MDDQVTELRSKGIAAAGLKQGMPDAQMEGRPFLFKDDRNNTCQKTPKQDENKKQTSQSIDRSIARSTNQSIKQSSNQAIKQSSNQAISQ